MPSIERNLLVWIMGALCFGSVAIVMVTYLTTLDEMNEAFDADLKNVAEALIVHRLSSDTVSGSEASKLPSRTDAADPTEIVTITWTRSGQRVFSSDPRVEVPFIGERSVSRLRVAQEDWIVHTDVGANGVAQAAQRATARHNLAVEAVLKILLPMLGIVVLVAGLLVFALRRGLRPLDRATRDIATRSAASLTPITAEDIPGEIAPLVGSINQLMGRLSLALSTQRRFVADAAHELRTPLTALRLQLQSLERADEEAERAEVMAELKAGVERSQHLVEQLLHVARFEPDGEPVRLEPVDLGKLVRTVVGVLSAKADHLRIDLGAGGDSGVAVDGDAGQLTVLLNNLVENALRFTPAGGVVDVEANLREGRPMLRVIDSGPGIPTAEHERVFARFYRGENAAPSTQAWGGSGLGLAIVRNIADRHGASVSLHTPRTGRGLEVWVAFPRAAA
jgi:signal transduction histidine kinase